MRKYTAYLSPIAEYKLLKLLDYIEVEFGINSRNKFLNTFSENIRLIEMNPFSCPETEIHGVYKNVVTRQTSFYFRIKNYDIEVVTLTDNRQNPQHIFKELKNLP